MAVLSFSVTYKVNGLVRSGKPKAGAEVIAASLSSSKAFFCFSVQLTGFSSGPARSSCQELSYLRIPWNPNPAESSGP